MEQGIFPLFFIRKLSWRLIEILGYYNITGLYHKILEENHSGNLLIISLKHLRKYETASPIVRERTLFLSASLECKYLSSDCPSLLTQGREGRSRRRRSRVNTTTLLGCLRGRNRSSTTYTEDDLQYGQSGQDHHHHHHHHHHHQRKMGK